MGGRHVREPQKTAWRFWWIWLVAGACVAAAVAGIVWWLCRPTATPVGTVPMPTVTSTTVPVTTTTPTSSPDMNTTTAPPPLVTPPPTAVEREFARPEQMRGVWLTEGVDYNKSGKADAATVRAEIDAALESLSAWSWNTLLVTLPSQIPLPSAFDAPAYILEKARERELFVYMIVDCGVRSGVHQPTRLGDREDLQAQVTTLALHYTADGFLLTDYAYAYTRLPHNAGDGIDAMLRGAVDAIHAVNKDAYVGLLTESVWAHSSVTEEGSATANVYEELTDGGADTRRLILDGAVDFVMVKNFRATGDYSAAFGTVLAWWDDLCAEADMPLYMAHAATNAAAGERRWSVRDQLARQVLACQSADAWQGSTFDSLAALQKANDAAIAAQQAFDGTLMEEYISRTLTVAEPAEEYVVTHESSISLRGSADPNFPVLLNGDALTLTDHGYFALDCALTPGNNTFVFENKGITTTYTVYYEVVIFQSVSPSEDMTLDGGASITVSAVALDGATMYATINGVRVPMQVVAVQDDENAASDDSDYVTYAGTYTLPEGKVGEIQSLGTVTLFGSYSGQSATETGGRITVKALPVTENPTVEDVTLPDLDPIDPSTGGDTLAHGTVLIITEDYAETFSGDTTDDYSRPTNAYLPKGTTDVLVGTAYDASSGNHYYLLGCGRRVYQETAKVYINGGTLAANTMTVGGVSVTESQTVLTFAANWRVPFGVQLLPQAYGNPSRQDYNSTAQTTEYVDITFSYTTETVGEVDVSSSPLFSSAEWIEGEDNTAILRLHLTAKAQFYGYRVMWDNEGQLTFSFKHPTYVGGNDAEQVLRGFTVVIDPGHGGHSYGTSGGGVPEKRLALTYGMLLRDQLEALGATVIMTRDDDSTLSLLERTQITRASGADLFISLHMDGSSSASVGGCSVHYFTDYSRGVAQLVYDEMQAVHEQYGNERKRRFRWDPFYVTRISEMPSLLLECGYMTNADDLELLVTPDFQDALMTAVVKGVVAYAQSLPNI